VVKDHAELARLGQVTPARVSQIALLAQLAPEIQEYILFLPAAKAELIREKDLRRIAREADWNRQAELFAQTSGLEANGFRGRGLNGEFQEDLIQR
jgi:hypothetical protein